MSCTENVVLCKFLSVLCPWDYTLYDCLLRLCKNMERIWCPKSGKIQVQRNFQSQLWFGMFVQNQVILAQHYVLILPHDPSQSCDSTPLEPGHRGVYTLSMNLRAPRGKVGWTQLQTAAGNRNWLLTAFTSILKQVFFSNASIFFILQPCGDKVWHLVYFFLVLKSGKICHNLQEL